MRNPTTRSLPLPLALVSGSSATRMVLQPSSSPRRNSSVDQGCRKAARSITITSSRSAGVMRRISSLARARTAILLSCGHGAGAVQRIEHADGGAAAEVGQELAQEPLVLLLRQLRAQRGEVLVRELPPPRRFLQLAVPELRSELEAVVEITGDAQLAGEDRADLLVGELDGAGERVVVGAGGKARAQPRLQRLHFSRLEIEQLQALHLREHDALLDRRSQRGGEDPPVEGSVRRRRALRFHQPDARLRRDLGQRDG